MPTDEGIGLLHEAFAERPNGARHRCGESCMATPRTPTRSARPQTHFLSYKPQCIVILFYKRYYHIHTVISFHSSVD